MEPITAENVIEAIRGKSNCKVVRPDNIPYEILKKLPELGINFLVILYNKINSLGLTPEGWKTTIMKLIPKPQEWNVRLDLTRPIILLQTCRKIYSFILIRRLTHKLKRKNILTGLNWVGLPGGRTVFPIIALNNMIENTKENQKSLWILF